MIHNLIFHLKGSFRNPSHPGQACKKYLFPCKQVSFPPVCQILLQYCIFLLCISLFFSQIKKKNELPASSFLFCLFFQAWIDTHFFPRSWDFTSVEAYIGTKCLYAIYLANPLVGETIAYYVYNIRQKQKQNKTTTKNKTKKNQQQQTNKQNMFVSCSVPTFYTLSHIYRIYYRIYYFYLDFFSKIKTELLILR